MFGPTLHETLDHAAAKSPSAAAVFPTASAADTLPELAAASVRMATALLAAGVAPGDRAGILCPNEPAFLRAVFALSRIGAAACPLPLPVALRDLELYVARLARVIEVAGIRHVVVTDGFTDLIDALGELLPGVTLLRAGQLDGPEDRRKLPIVDPSSIAVVQFTSGSTASPKGVLLSQDNVLGGLDAIASGVDMGRPGDAGAVWLPLYHDMGLFGSLSALLSGLPMYIWSPVSFVKNPQNWLRELMATGHDMICPLPNFGYDYLLQAFAKSTLDGLDMSRWRVAFNGSEAIDSASVGAFCDRFAPAGFRASSMFPVYGLAEATLAATFPPLGREPSFDWVDAARLATDGVAEPAAGTRARAIANVGPPVKGLELRIDGTTADGVVGEVQLRGRPVTQGYLAAEQPFTADGWLRTGDLGYTRNGDLHVTGRIKEMIIVRGENFYPEDVEGAVRDLPGIHKRRVVALADGETMVLAAETRLSGPDRVRLHTEITELAGRVLGLAGSGSLAVHLLPPRSIERTTSGKLQRLAMLQKINSGSDRATAQS
ncbi:AMP-binding protein [Longispora albida]|uniref:AMP-binding protein n=1 Tax=Longispora albida TaxID=203523 RepID=UPI0003682BB3|nr:AMP-binding protein [Longispora albida]